MRQAIFIALGLALGVGLVVTVAATSAGVAKAQATVLGALYGMGTGVTVTGAMSISRGSIAASRRQDGGQDAQIEMGPGGYELCDLSGTCKSVAGQTVVSSRGRRWRALRFLTARRRRRVVVDVR
jgi:putative ABC transport system permease protein